MLKHVRVMVFGTFDFLHVGHLRLFEQAKKHGTHLTAVVARDETVVKTKGKKPVFGETERWRLVAALRIVDKAVLGNNYFRDKTEIILENRPDVIVLGYDQNIDPKKLKAELAAKAWRGKIVRAKGHLAGTAKTSKLKKRILQAG